MSKLWPVEINSHPDGQISMTMLHIMRTTTGLVMYYAEVQILVHVLYIPLQIQDSEEVPVSHALPDSLKLPWPQIQHQNNPGIYRLLKDVKYVHMCSISIIQGTARQQVCILLIHKIVSSKHSRAQPHTCRTSTLATLEQNSEYMPLLYSRKQV